MTKNGGLHGLHGSLIFDSYYIGFFLDTSTKHNTKRILKWFKYKVVFLITYGGCLPYGTCAWMNDGDVLNASWRVWTDGDRRPYQ